MSEIDYFEIRSGILYIRYIYNHACTCKMNVIQSIRTVRFSELNTITEQ